MFRVLLLFDRIRQNKVRHNAKSQFCGVRDGALCRFPYCHTSIPVHRLSLSSFGFRGESLPHRYLRRYNWTFPDRQLKMTQGFRFPTSP